MNFLELRTAVLGYINRPASEFDTFVGNEINAVLLQMQRLHEFKLSERLVKIVYPAATLQLDITGACEGLPRNYLNTQLLTNATDNEGQLIKICSYNALQSERFQYQRANGYSDYSELSPTHSDYVSMVQKVRMFLTGKAIGLYPVPITSINLLLNLSIWLPDLIDDTDTNFLTDFASDLIIDKAVDRLNYFMKEDARSEVAVKYTQEGWEALMQWDSQVRLASDA